VRSPSKTFPGLVRGTADPSTALRSGRDDKGEGCDFIWICYEGWGNRRSLGYARDDKGWGGASIEHMSRGLKDRASLVSTYAVLCTEPLNP
jgi:hypothetical protein